MVYRGLYSYRRAITIFPNIFYVLFLHVDLGLIDMFLINLIADIVACILSFRKSRHKPNLENTSKYGIPPIRGDKMAAF